MERPIASFRAEASVALPQWGTTAEYEGSLVHMRDEPRRLSAIVDDLFTLARLDAADGALERHEFFLEELLLESVSRIRPLATDRGLALTFHPTVEARCCGDPLL